MTKAFHVPVSETEERCSNCGSFKYTSVLIFKVGRVCNNCFYKHFQHVTFVPFRGQTAKAQIARTSFGVKKTG
jgi:hypothetical protein